MVVIMRGALIGTGAAKIGAELQNFRSIVGTARNKLKCQCADFCTIAIRSNTLRHLAGIILRQAGIRAVFACGQTVGKFVYQITVFLM
jgi:hypothetical protein